MILQRAAALGFQAIESGDGAGEITPFGAVGGEREKSRRICPKPAGLIDEVVESWITPHLETAGLDVGANAASMGGGPTPFDFAQAIEERCGQILVAGRFREQRAFAERVQMHGGRCEA